MAIVPLRILTQYKSHRINCWSWYCINIEGHPPMKSIKQWIYWMWKTSMNVMYFHLSIISWWKCVLVHLNYIFKKGKITMMFHVKINWYSLLLDCASMRKLSGWQVLHCGIDYIKTWCNIDWWNALRVNWRIITYQNNICDVLIFDLVVLWYSKQSLWNMIAYCIVPTWKTIVLVVMFDTCCPSYFSFFSVWLSARWALHSPDNLQRIILHALCLVKIRPLYMCRK